MSTMREELTNQLQSASKQLQKYEDKLLKGSEENPLPKEMQEFFFERVRFWSDEVKALRTEIFNLKSQVGVQ
jgi:hypothetical protein